MGKVKEMVLFDTILEFIYDFNNHKDNIESVGVTFNNGDTKTILMKDILEINTSFIKYKMEFFAKGKHIVRHYIIPLNNNQYLWLDIRSAEETIK